MSHENGFSIKRILDHVDKIKCYCRQKEEESSCLLYVSLGQGRLVKVKKNTNKFYRRGDDGTSDYQDYHEYLKRGMMGFTPRL